MNRNPLLPRSDYSDDNDAAVRLIRNKVAQAYASEPDAAQELAEVSHEKVLSKHQRHMQGLSASGKSLAEIQTEWHRYYTQLPDDEKHEVWQEFYSANQHTPYQKLFQKQQEVHLRKHEEQPVERPAVAAPTVSSTGVTVGAAEPKPATKRKQLRPLPAVIDKPAVRELKARITDKVSAGGKLKAKHHLQSLAFGLGAGLLVLVVLLFTFFNDRIIAPFIQPGRAVGNTPIILSDSTTNLNAPPAVTIPKINVQIPLDFNVKTLDEADVEEGLKRGVVHYATTAMPGQNGNGAYFGHSAVNIFNNGEKYGFAFTLLHKLTTGDVFYITYSGKTYAYRIFEMQVVSPSQVSVLHDTRGKTATAALITCDPPGSSANRLVVWGEQVSPAVSTNTATDTTTAAQTSPQAIASNGPSLFSRMIDAITFWN